ncbi:hypothetical protein MPER_12545 [Moniliophthora perniciosa FA553]|nr:hypothetical protein MPER_12545 [Moniliophthora perniciosa FA553]
MMLKQVVEEKVEQLNRLKKESRAALLASKRVIDSMSLSNREELLQSAAGKQQTVEGKGKSREDALMEANNNVTEGLRRTIGLMQGELERSLAKLIVNTESSTKTLQATSTAHDTLTFTMDASKTLITALAKSDWQDRALIIAGLVFFLCVVLFIVKERVLDRSIRLAFWWTRFIPDFSGDKELLKAEEMLAATTLAALVSSTLSSAGPDVTATLESLTTMTSEGEPLQTTIPDVLSSTLSTTSTDPESTPTSTSIDDTHIHEEL